LNHFFHNITLKGALPLKATSKSTNLTSLYFFCKFLIMKILISFLALCVLGNNFKNELEFLIIFFSDYENETILFIQNFIREKFCKNVIVKNDKLGIKFYNKKRKQFNASLILDYIVQKYKSENYSVIITFIDEDCYVEGLNFIFGLADPKSKACLVATKRYHQSFYNLKEDKKIFLERLRKEITHELGHIFGLSHCTLPDCVMYFSNSIFDTDKKSENFCERCRKILDNVLEK